MFLFDVLLFGPGQVLGNSFDVRFPFLGLFSLFLGFVTTSFCTLSFV